MCLCLPASYVLWKALFSSLAVCTGFSAFALCQFAASVLTVVTGLLIFISYSFVVRVLHETLVHIHAVHVYCVPMVPAEMSDYWSRGQKQLLHKSRGHANMRESFLLLLLSPSIVEGISLSIGHAPPHTPYSCWAALLPCVRGVSWKQTKHYTPVELSRGLLHPSLHKHLRLFTWTNNFAVSLMSFMSFFLVQSSNFSKCLWIRAQPFICVSHPL